MSEALRGLLEESVSVKEKKGIYNSLFKVAASFDRLSICQNASHSAGHFYWAQLSVVCLLFFSVPLSTELRTFGGYGGDGGGEGNGEGNAFNAQTNGHFTTRRQQSASANETRRRRRLLATVSPSQRNCCQYFNSRFSPSLLYGRTKKTSHCLHFLFFIHNLYHLIFCFVSFTIGNFLFLIKTIKIFPIFTAFSS